MLVIPPDGIVVSDFWVDDGSEMELFASAVGK